MDWNSGSRGRMPTLQVQSLEFKSQSHQKKKKKKRKKEAGNLGPQRLLRGPEEGFMRSLRLLSVPFGKSLI
jgi:hypothetical protein